ncbi:hypothetical protein GCK32_013665 [Trichostrongylus colubriformis]|uniref:Uncharacterized protein n=1 Tax=Trichostrongylus colubriformis TaxID=6319 RepID=A0AAN8IWA2_TRICO
MLLEDDALVVPEFAKMMASLMRQLDSRRYIDYVKLYHPNQLRKIPSIPLAIALSLIICCIFQIIAFRRVFFLWLLATCAPMYVNLRSYGSQFLADVRYAITKSVYITEPESCCTPAVVFRTQKILEMVSKLSVESTKHAFVGHAKDHILDESDFVGRQTDTNLVVHIGAVSSVRKRRITLNEVLAARNRED